ncbi:MAG: 6-bladed beta-propeller [Gammaproteobacteria bacterium]|jgi:DNA-binding beta-propeller fold protein YncE|nr:6-bladed beta-propeller [Gammaproteobacteria bacterium]MBT4859374.1 6-bladed beta-propeller [Gammaproteobacteria bacterium]MBT5503794.1 6-bladed beta-propeller [Candidatus Falkowbacteria bacterium]MBT6553637.1 6-bladed beta-propeller [Gammaproteobacteria bacterium]
MNEKISSQLIGIISAISILILASGCAGKGAVFEKAELKQKPSVQSVWPAPPEQARIRYLGSLKTSEIGDEVQKLSVSDILLGKKKEDSNNVLTSPYGVHSNSNGKVFVTDTGNSGLVVFDLIQNTVSHWGKSGSGLLTKALGITSDTQGNVYVSDTYDKRIVVFDKDGNYLNAFGGKDVLVIPSGLAFNDTTQQLFVADAKKNQILVFDNQGKIQFTIGEKGNEPGKFNFPTNISLNKENSLLFVADSMNFRVQVFKMDGTFVDTFGVNGNRPGDFSRLKGIGLDTEGHVYAVDAAFNNFQILDQAGKLLLAVGRASVEADGFYLPTGLHVDRNNKIFVADQYNQRIQMFQYLGETKKP